MSLNSRGLEGTRGVPDTWRQQAMAYRQPEMGQRQNRVDWQLQEARAGMDAFDDGPEKDRNGELRQRGQLLENV